MLSLKETLKTIIENHSVRVKKSQYGVGLFSTRLILKNECKFVKSFKFKEVSISKKIMGNFGIVTNSMKQLFDDFYLQGDKYVFDHVDVTSINVCNFINHSNSSNVKFLIKRNTCTLIATRNIEENEEILFNYHNLKYAYSNPNWMFLKK